MPVTWVMFQLDLKAFPQSRSSLRLPFQTLGRAHLLASSGSAALFAVARAHLLASSGPRAALFANAEAHLLSSSGRAAHFAVTPPRRGPRRPPSASPRQEPEANRR